VIRKKNEQLEKKLEGEEGQRAHACTRTEELEAGLVRLKAHAETMTQKVEAREVDLGNAMAQVTEYEHRLAKAEAEFAALKKELAAALVARNHALEESQRTQFLLDSANVRNSELLGNLQEEGRQRLTEVAEARHLVETMAREVDNIGLANADAFMLQMAQHSPAAASPEPESPSPEGKRGARRKPMSGQAMKDSAALKAMEARVRSARASWAMGLVHTSAVHGRPWA